MSSPYFYENKNLRQKVKNMKDYITPFSLKNGTL